MAGDSPISRRVSPIMAKTPGYLIRIYPVENRLVIRPIRLQTEVAQASASAMSQEKIVTASAHPNEMETATIADEVHLRGLLSPAEGRRNTIRLERTTAPAWLQPRIERSLMSAMSPPLSITPKRAPASTIASTPAHAIAPATAAMGPEHGLWRGVGQSGG